MLAKLLKPATVCKEANYSRNDISSDFNSSRTARISRKVSNSRKTSNMQQGRRPTGTEAAAGTRFEHWQQSVDAGQQIDDVDPK
jgi:hypothetical protein